MTAPTPNPSDIALGFVAMLESMRVVLDAVDGYRAECLRRDYSPTAAEQMAMAYHHALLSGMGGGKS